MAVLSAFLTLPAPVVFLGLLVLMAFLIAHFGSRPL